MGRQGVSRGVVAAILSAAACALAAAPAAAAPLPVGGTPPPITVPKFGHFRAVLAQGEGQTVNAVDLAAYEATGTPPDTFTSQTPLYAGIMPHAATLKPSDLDAFYKDTDFGSMPGGVGSVEQPRAGVEIFRDKKYGMAHIWGATRSDVMWAAGYAQAEERLFLMDALRRTAEGNLAGLLGASAAPGDAQQLTDQDFSPKELTDQFNALPQKFGAEGERAHQDLLDFVDGINARITEDKLNPTEMPAEYVALGTTPAQWTVADSAAEAVLLVTQFTVSNGNEQVNAMLQQAFQKRFGSAWQSPYHDLREANDPEALTVAKTPFPSDDPGPVQAGLNALPDPGSLKPRNAEVSGPDAAQASQAKAALPAWARSVEGLRGDLPPVESNAVMVAGKLSRDGRPLAAMGPQVGYYSPQIFSEYELHGGGIDEEGVTFPGASPYVLIGHGIDFAWSGTSANGDNEDTFVEKLCNPDGSAPSDASTHYLYKGQCVPFTMRDQSVTTPVAPTSPAPPQTITYRTMRSVHGPVFEFGTVDGQPVALTKAKAVDFHELDAVISFMRMAENHPRNAAEFMSDFGTFPGTENWFYVDNRDVAWQQSGVYPRHATGSDVDLPFWGDGRADWIGFDPSAYTASYLPPSARPNALDPTDGFIISWNNKEAPGWRKGPAEWDGGPIQHARILQERLLNEVQRGGGTTDLTGLARAVNMTATTDLREWDVYPLLRRVIGHAGGEEGQMLALLDRWHRDGSQRLAPAGGNVYGDSPAIALFDRWWPDAVKAIFEPPLGSELFGQVQSDVLGLPAPGRFGGYDWTSHVWKDMRDLLDGSSRPGAFSRIYCGDGTVASCRGVLLASLDQAIAQTKAALGPDPSNWQVDATCKITSPPSCDQEVPNTAGAVDTPPFPWQDRGTYHQIDELTGHR
ncbi:MAG TPA: penicillin acylase family protein [Thermoleophilaceae bacterium]